MKIKIHALRRSGSHAIIHWLCTQTEKRTLFVNDCQSSLQETINKDIKNLTLYENGKIIVSRVNLYEINNKKFDNFLYNFEDKEYNCSNNNDNAINIFIIRDVFNNFASRYNLILSKLIPDWLEVKEAVNLWKYMAKHYLNNSDKFILYNKWFTDERYRKEISNTYNLKFKDIEENYISDYGGGSSFDKKVTKCSELKIFSRYQKFFSDKNFWNIFDEECFYLNKKIFGFSPKL